MSTSTIYRSTARDLTGPVREFLGRRQHLVLATRNPDGSIHAVPVLYLFHDGCFLVATSSTSRKARNIAARPDVTVTVDDRTEQAWVSAVGTAELLHGQRSRELNRRVYRTWMTEAGVTVVGEVLGRVEDVTIVINPHRWRAWDVASTFYPFLAAAGVPLDEPERWFLS